MATTRKVDLKIEIAGEKEYKSAIAELNKGNQVLASELRKVQEQFKGNENSIEALNAKGDVLQRQLQQQKDKVQTLRDALKNAATEYGEADSRTQEWQIKLNNAETAQIKLERAIEENNKAIDQQENAMEDAGKAVGGLGDQVDELGGALGIRLPSMAKDALNSMEGFSAGTVAKLAAVAGGAAAVIKVTQELFDLTKQAALEADALLTRSAQTGLSTDLLQQLDYAQQFLDFDGLDKSLQRLTQSMGNATNASTKQAEAFRTLGVSIYDENGNLRDNYDVFLDVIDALGNVESETQRDILANQLFSKGYAELKPLIQAGSAELTKYTDHCKEMGYVLEEDGVRALGRFNDAMDENRAAIKAAKDDLAAALAPMFETFVELSTGAVNLTHDLFNNDIFQTIAGAVSAPLGALMNVTEGAKNLQNWLDKLNGTADETEAAGERMTAAITPMQEAVQALADKYQEAQEKYREMLDGQFGLFEDASERLLTDSDRAAQALGEFWNKSYEAAEKSIQAQFGLFDEVSTEIAKTPEDLEKALDSQIAYWAQYEDNLDALLHSGIDGIQEFVAAHSDGSAKSVEAIAVLAAATDEEKEQILASWQALQEKQGEVAAGYADMATAGAASAEELAGSTESYAQRTIAALESQAQYWQEYNADFDALKARNIEGIDELAEKFMDGSAESKAALAELRGASDEEIAAIIAKMHEVETGRGGIADTFAALDVDLSEQFAKIKSDFAGAIQDIAGTAGAIDFTPFNTAVENSFSFLAETSKTGNENMAAAFEDGTTKSAESLETFETVTAEKIAAIIETLDTTEQAKDDFTHRFQTMTEETTADLDQIETTAGEFVEEFNGIIATVDFSPFTDSVDSAFSFLEERAWSSIDNVRAWLAELSAEIDAVEARAASVDVGHNAGGTDNWRGGLTYLAENGPELVDLPQGSRVHTAQETRQILGGGTDMRETEAKLDRAVALLGQISTELSGLRVRGRMA